jgi:hypothetical protein
MSREQWGHGYWQGVEDAQSGTIRKKYTFKDEVKFWIANMCISNCSKTYDASLFSVRDFVFYITQCGLSEKYAKKVYDYILKHNMYDFKPKVYCECYVSGDKRWKWFEDYFVLPISCYTRDEWQQIANKLKSKFEGGN